MDSSTSGQGAPTFPVSNGAGTPASAPAPASSPSREAPSGVAKKYIRTFAGDMEVLKKGGTPDLAPLLEPAGAASVPPQAPQAPITAPAPAFRPPPIDAGPASIFRPAFSAARPPSEN